MKTCDYCGKEFKPRTPDHRFCHKQCRWDYNNAQKQIGQNTQDSVYTPIHAPESAVNGSPTIARLEAKIDRLYAIIERQQATIELMALSQAASPKLTVSGKDTPIDMKPIDSSEIVIEVKQSTAPKVATAGQNFLASMNGLMKG